LVASRGNTNLESTLRLTKDLKEEIDRFDDKIQEVSESYNASKKDSNSINNVELYMLDLLSRIEEAIPLINLSLTTSGANLSGTLSNQVSPGRLLQASNHVNKSNEAFKGDELQIGPSFQLTLYSIFYHRGRIINNKLNEISWKEEFTRADVSIWRQASTLNEYQYFLKIKENFNDERYHDDEDEPKLIELDISTITRLFFSASGKLLKLEDRSTPVLVLKINKSFQNFENESSEDEEKSIDQDIANPIEWLSLGEYEQLYNSTESDSSDSEDEEPQEPQQPQQNNSLSLLEYILRLCVLQSNDQSSILEVNDERLALYLNDENNSEKPMAGTIEEDTFENDSSSPVRIIERKKKTITTSGISNRSTPRTSPKGTGTGDLTSRLKKIEINNNEDDDNNPKTPQRKFNDEENEGKNQKLGGSPVPGELESNIKLTPWEKDKISKLRTPIISHGQGNQNIGYGTPTNTLRKKVLRRTLHD